MTEAVKDETANLKPATDFVLGKRKKSPQTLRSGECHGCSFGSHARNSVDVTSLSTLRPLPPKFDLRSCTESFVYSSVILKKVLAYRQADNSVTERETFETLVLMLFAWPN